MKKLMILATVVGLFAMVGMAFAQPVDSLGPVGVTFDEAGTVPMGTFAEVGVPDANGFTTHINVYIVTWGLSDMNAFEFSLTNTGAASLATTKTVYGPAPTDLGSGLFDVAAGVGACLTDASQMGADPNSWTMCKWDFNYFGSPGDDVMYCVAPSTSDIYLPEYPIVTGCDTAKHDMPPANVDTQGITPEGCALLNPTQGQDVVGDDVTSWGSLKAGF